MVAEALRANVQTYSVDPRGAGAAEELTIEIIGQPPPRLPIDLRHEIARSQNVLRMLADQTGGQSAVGTDGFDAVFMRLVQDNSAYYVIAYSPTNTKPDGKFHSISVRVKRPGLTVRARQGYYAPPDPAHHPAAVPKDPLTRVIESPLPRPGLGLRLVAAAVGPADAGRVRISAALEIDGSQLTFAAKDGAFLDTLDVGYLVPDAEGKRVAGDRDTLNLRLQPDTKDAVAGDGLRYVTEFTLPPGRYHLRMAAVEHDRTLQGSVMYDLEVPNESAAPLVMGQIVLTTARASVMPTVGN